MISAQRYPARREKLKRLIRKAKLPALLVTDVTNVTYLTGFTGDSSWLVIGGDVEMLLSDGRYTVQLAEECPEITAEIRPVSQKLPDAGAELLKTLKLTACGFEAGAMSYSVASLLKEAATATELVPTDGLVESLRTIKDADEITAIRQAVYQAEKGFEFLRGSLTPEMSELDIAFTVEAGMRRFGALGMSFPVIAAVGPRAALPHARPGTPTCQESPFLLLDWGARAASGYVSDLTRMIVTGSISSKLQRLYEVVQTAQEQAIAAIRPGVKANEVDRVARGVIESAGLGPQFNHGLGHGIGLEVHESTRMSPSSEEELKAGMVLTVEPGVYFADWGGIRIEDDVLVTRDGFEILSSLPKELDSCRVIC